MYASIVLQKLQAGQCKAAGRAWQDHGLVFAS